MKKNLLFLMGILMIISCSTDESGNSINSNLSEKTMIKKSIDIEKQIINDLEDKYNSLQVGDELEAVEI